MHTVENLAPTASSRDFGRGTNRPFATNVNEFRKDGIPYDRLRGLFRIEFPREYNLALDTVGRWAAGEDGERIALVCPGPFSSSSYSYLELNDLSDRLAAFLASQGVSRGDVVVVYTTQGLAAAIAPLALYKLGAVCAPLSLLYGPRTMEHVLGDCGARAIVTEPSALAKLREAGVDLSQIKLRIVDGSAPDSIPLDQAIASRADGFVAARTAADDPALLLYTSGSTGLPKGILHAHRFLIGYFASVSMFYELDMDEPGMVLWTPSDWSWIAGIVNVMLTGWHFRQTVVAGQARFSPEWAFDFLQRHGVTHCFLTPTALKRMAEIPDPRERWPNLKLRAIGTGGEPLPAAVLDWSTRVLEVPINEFYGLTEVNHLIGNCQRLYPAKPGSMGRAYPGHTVAVLNREGEPVADGTVGEIAASDDDPTLFLGYWNQPERTASMRAGRWVRTGDFGLRDADGYFWYHGRDDDLIKSAGYRIGPAEIEDVLIRHPAVAEAGVFGRPDPERGQIVVAHVRLADGQVGDKALKQALQAYVKAELAPYKYPREIVFVSEFPTTTTGKISRKELRRRDAERFGGAVSATTQQPGQSPGTIASTTENS